MKISVQKRAGVTLPLAILLLALFLIFIGILVYIIWKAIDSLPTHHTEEERNAAVEVERASIEQEYRDAGYSNVVVQTVASSVVEMPTAPVPAHHAFSPFSLAGLAGAVTIERSTNLVDWEVIGTVTAGERIVDTNPPLHQAFYRLR